jgi:hypothetical protein
MIREHHARRIPDLKEFPMRFAALIALLCALPAVPLEDSLERRIEERLDKALRESSERTLEAMKHLVQAELAPRAVSAETLAKVKKAITEANVKADVEYLASDELKGRETAKKGHRLAAEWAGARFAEFGLKKLEGADAWYQKFKFGGKDTMNVVGLLEGETDEIVVIGAHLDHVGTGEAGWWTGRIPHKDAGNDTIHNGADDNASGSAALIEIARALSSLQKKPRRGILFILFSGEEKGLLGSLHYCKEPLLPLAKTVAMLNLDMVGRNKDRHCMVIGGSTSADLAAALERANKGFGMTLNVDKAIPAMPIWFQSDQASFYRAGVPALFFTTGMHPEYHTALDHADLINTDKLEEVAELAAVVALEVAGSRTRPEYVKLNLAQRPRLGVNLDEVEGEALKALDLGKGEGAVKLVTVQKGMPAGKAGLLAGDIILSWDGRALPEGEAMVELRRLITEVVDGATVKMEIVRKGERQTVKVYFPR